MPVGHISNESEANRLRPRDISEKKKIHQKEQKPQKTETANPKKDSVEISHVAKSLLRKLVVENNYEKPKYPELQNLEEKLLRKMGEELSEDFEIREKRVAEVVARLKEAYYDRPDVLMSTAKQIVNELFGE